MSPPVAPVTRHRQGRQSARWAGRLANSPAGSDLLAPAARPASDPSSAEVSAAACTGWRESPTAAAAAACPCPLAGSRRSTPSPRPATAGLAAVWRLSSTPDWSADARPDSRPSTWRPSRSFWRLHWPRTDPGAAVADGIAGDDDTVMATTAAPPRAVAAKVARRPRRGTAVIDLIDPLLTVCERFGTPKTLANLWQSIPDHKTGRNGQPTYCHRHRWAHEFSEQMHTSRAGDPQPPTRAARVPKN